MKNVLVILSIGFFFSGCNEEVNKDEQNNQGQNLETVSAELVALDDQLPEAAIMRVEIDADGNVIPGTEELRTVAMLGGESLAASFDSSEAPKAGSAELDQDSSTQSWYVTKLDDSSQEQTYSDQTSQYPSNQTSQYPSNQTSQYPSNQTSQYPTSQYPSSGYPHQDQRNTVEHRQGPSTSVYPVSNKTIYEHRSKDVYPQKQIDIYPIEKVRIHPTQVTTRVHPVQRQVQYVGNHCKKGDPYCSYGSQYYPTVSYGSHNQYYHYQSYQNHSRYRYFQYCRPRILARLFGW